MLYESIRCAESLLLKSGKPLARHYVIHGKSLTDWRVLLSVFFRSDLEHGFSFGRIGDNR